MVAEVTSNENYEQWNKEIYAASLKELNTLLSKGYKGIIMGDLNGHVSLPPAGVQGGQP